jgi:hypothetical protein
MRGTTAAFMLAVLLAAGCESTTGETAPEKKDESGKSGKAEGGKESKSSPSDDSYEGSGFAVWVVEGRWWVFREGSKENADFVKGVAKGMEPKDAVPAKQVTRTGADVTLKAPDAETLDAFEAWKRGFTIRVGTDGRTWVFKMGAKELADFDKAGELAKHVTRIGVGPRGATLKAPDAETLDAWVAAK